jgi:hypothetical protein
MRRISKVFIVAFLICLTIHALDISFIKAQEENRSIIILLDNSGSMQKTDPYRLSVSAASMLIDTLDNSTSLNIIPFGNLADKSIRLSDKPYREALKSRLSELRFDSENTNLKEGIKEAINQFNGVQGEKIIIVLSDGKEDPLAGVTDAHMKELFSLGEGAGKQGIKIHAIGLSESADEETLSKLSDSTGGDYFFSDSASDLFTIFNKILGQLNGYYTLEQFMTDASTDKEINLSSYVEEVIVKVASNDNSNRLVEVAFSDNIKPEVKTGNKYKIYKYANIYGNKSSFRVYGNGNENNSVIVQVKFKVKINSNPTNENLSIPFKVPLDVQLSVETKEEIKGLHMDRLEEGERKRIEGDNKNFNFTLAKEKPGKYPIFITAYDGEGNIVAIKELNLNAKDVPSFYYSQKNSKEVIPSEIIGGSQRNIEIIQLDDSKVSSISGEVYVEYSDSQEKFPLKFENGVLAAKLRLEKPGEIKLTSRIEVIKDNKNYSYFLPYFNSKVLERPFVELDAEKEEVTFREKEQVFLRLNIEKNSLYDNSDFLIYSDKTQVGEFTLTKDSKGSVKVPLRTVEKGSGFIFTIKPKDESSLVKVTDKINASIRIISPGRYLIEKYKTAVIAALGLTALVSLIWLICRLTYKILVENYEAKIRFQYCINDGEYNANKTVLLSYRNRIKYINLYEDIQIDAREDNAVGSFVLKVPEGPKLLQGIRVIFNRKASFQVIYKALMEQARPDGVPISTIPYSKGKQLVANDGTNIVTIRFL